MLNFYISASQTYNLFKEDYIYSRATFNSILVDNMLSHNGGMLFQESRISHWLKLFQKLANDML